jgi:hypothetical protein
VFGLVDAYLTAIIQAVSLFDIPRIAELLRFVADCGDGSISRQAAIECLDSIRARVVSGSYTEAESKSFNDALYKINSVVEQLQVANIPPMQPFEPLHAELNLFKEV